jgi:hypothetical protein
LFLAAFGNNVSKELCYLPLAIVQAGAFISQSWALNSYLDIYMKNQAQLLSKKPAQSHDDYVWTVYTTWQMSFNQLSQPAAMFLQLWSRGVFVRYWAAIIFGPKREVGKLISVF